MKILIYYLLENNILGMKNGFSKSEFILIIKIHIWRKTFQKVEDLEDIKNWAKFKNGNEKLSCKQWVSNEK